MPDRPWWRDAVVYQLYPRSFADSDGDGVGDIRGVISRLDHLAWLGVDAIWLSPIHPSPNADWGYDVADYLGVHPELGTLDDVDDLVREAGERGMRVVLDLVPNHTSDAHPWFVDARSSRRADHRDWYVWADPKPDGSPPNNWVSTFGGPAWTLDDATGQYYLHNFLPQQPDLNWWNEEVRDAFDEILRFWFDRGIAGFRLDVCHMVVKDRELRDNPPSTDDDHFTVQLRGQRPVYNADRPEVHDVLRRWRTVGETYDPPRMFLGEVYLFDLDRVAQFFGAPGQEELSLAFNFSFLFTPFEAAAMRDVVESTEAAVPIHAWPTWTGSNHDASRFPTRWAQGDAARMRCALMMLLTLRGTPVLYYGDEIGMQDTPLERDDVLDPVGVRFWPLAGRDPERTPMHWSGDPGAGFTKAGVTPWLPLGDHAACNVEAQRSDPGSMLHLCRDLIAIRQASDDLRAGDYATLPTPDGVWGYRRGSGMTVLLNLSDDAHSEATVSGIEGVVRIGTRRERDGEAVVGSISLHSGEGVVVERA
ncbi:MAG TPA: alpha-amylase family glycosyl hydrolase [Acidimicrobiia bacterium]|nr:alpha-amylase family glycosyl hydrolase [Acidimicrobiia bacterium]